MTEWKNAVSMNWAGPDVVPLDDEIGWRDREIVFVVGQHRSGTTLLAELMARHSGFSGLTDTGVPENEGQHLQTVLRDRKGRVLAGVGSMGLKPKHHLTENSRYATPEYGQKVWQEWSPYWDLSRRWLVEKSPGHLTKTRLLQSWFPKARFVLITRHPIAQIMAIRKWVGNRSSLQHITNWVAAHAKFEIDGQHLNSVTRIRYEDLCSEPERIMSLIFEVCGATPERVIDRTISNSNQKYFDQWHERLRRPSVRLEARVAKLLYGRTIERWGYSLDVQARR